MFIVIYITKSYFLEDGVEEENEISFNQAAHVHSLGPYVNPSTFNNGELFGAQYLNLYTESPDMILPSDMAAGTSITIFYD